MINSIDMQPMVQGLETNGGWFIFVTSDRKFSTLHAKQFDTSKGSFKVGKVLKKGKIGLGLWEESDDILWFETNVGMEGKPKLGYLGGANIHLYDATFGTPKYINLSIKQQQPPFD